MTYLSGRFQRRKSYKKYILLAVVFCTVVFFWSFVKKTTYPAILPVAVGYNGVKNTAGILPDFLHTYLSSRKSLVATNRNLEIEVERLENKVRDQDAELKELRDQFSYDGEVKQQLKPLTVLYPLMKDITSLYSTILLSKGFKDGLDIGEIVTVRGGQAVCTIKEVYTSSSLCLLLTASGVTTEGVTSSSSITLSLVGRGGYYLANIVRDTPVTVGETVYLRSDPTMVLGTVKEVSNNDQDTSWHVFVEGVYNPMTSSIFYVRP